MTMISKTAGGLSLISSLYDIHKTALITAKNQSVKMGTDSYISTSLGAQKANRLSYKDAARKNWLEKHAFLQGPAEVVGAIGGYIKGVAQGVIRYLPNIGLSAIALTAKNKTVAGVSAIGLALLEGYDFIVNSTKFGQKTDYLK